MGMNLSKYLEKPCHITLKDDTKLFGKVRRHSIIITKDDKVEIQHGEYYLYNCDPVCKYRLGEEIPLREDNIKDISESLLFYW